MADKLEWVGDVLWDAAGAPVAVLRTVDRKPPGPDSRWSYTVHGYPGSREEYATRELARSAVERFLASEAPELPAKQPAAQAPEKESPTLRAWVKAEFDRASRKLRSVCSRVATHASQACVETDLPYRPDDDAPINSIAHEGRNMHYWQGYRAALVTVLREIDGKAWT